MFYLYKEIEGKLKEEIIEKIDENTKIDSRTWLSFDEPNNANLEKISKLTNIPLHFLSSSLDPEETARVDKEDDNVLIVLDVPCSDENSEGNFKTMPFIIAYNNDFYITISHYNKTLIPAVLLKTKGVEPQKHARLTLNLIYQLSKEFIYFLKRIDAKTREIETKLHSSTKNRELYQMMDINKSLVYFATALNSNKAVLSKLIRSPNYQKFEGDFDLMEDTEVELNQAIEMCTIYRGILAGLTDTFASVVNNNLNIVMKTLTTITIIISIPTLIASLFGMNFVEENSPLYFQEHGFFIVLGICCVAAIIGTAILLLLTNRRRK